MTHHQKAHSSPLLDAHHRIAEQFTIGFCAALGYVPEEWIVRHVRATAAVHGHQWAAELLGRGRHLPPSLARQLLEDLAAEYTVRVVDVGQATPCLYDALASIATRTEA